MQADPYERALPFFTEGLGVYAKQPTLLAR